MISSNFATFLIAFAAAEAVACFLLGAWVAWRLSRNLSPVPDFIPRAAGVTSGEEGDVQTPPKAKKL